jgi:hypothetical protein
VWQVGWASLGLVAVQVLVGRIKFNKIRDENSRVYRCRHTE